MFGDSASSAVDHYRYVVYGEGLRGGILHKSADSAVLKDHRSIELLDTPISWLSYLLPLPSSTISIDLT